MTPNREPLETQVAKINLGTSKQATSHVVVVGEKIDLSQAEIFFLCELPLLNPAAEDDCEHITSAMFASLQRSYRKPVKPESFELALADLNEELAKLAGMAKTHWINKLSAGIVIKHDRNLWVATIGKTIAWLWRDGQLSPMTEPNSPGNILKTFDQFSEGRTRPGDIIVLATGNIEQYIKRDEISNLLDGNNLPEAARDILAHIHDNAGPEIALGLLLAAQTIKTAVIPATTIYVPAAPVGPQISSQKQSRLSIQSRPTREKITDFIRKTSRQIAELWRKQLERMRTGYFQAKPKTAKLTHDHLGQTHRHTWSVPRLQQYSTQKRWFALAGIILLLVLCVNLIVSRYYKSPTTTNTATPLSSIKQMVIDTQVAVTNGDNTLARQNLLKLKSALANPIDTPKGQDNDLATVRTQAAELETRIEKRVTINPIRVGSLNNGEFLIGTPQYIGTEQNRTVVTYNRQDGTFSDSVWTTGEPAIAAAYVRTNVLALYNGQSLFAWDPSTGRTEGAYSGSDLPKNNKNLQLSSYALNNRVYFLDTSAGRVVSLLAGNRTMEKPTTALTDSNLNDGIDLSVDGSIYVLTKTGMLKFTSGKRQDFTLELPNELTDRARLYTDTIARNLYVLDPDHQKVLVFDKQGQLLQSMVSAKFDNLKDIYVDEKAGEIYLLNGSDLYLIKQ